MIVIVQTYPLLECPRCTCPAQIISREGVVSCGCISCDWQQRAALCVYEQDKLVAIALERNP